MRRLGVMGGTFDPPHFGHLAAASEAAYRLGLDRVAFVPTGDPWQKDPQGVSAAKDRVHMTHLAIAQDPRFFLSRVDVDRQKKTYTVDTLRDLSREFPGVKLYFILGADSLASLTTWKNWAEIHGLATLVGVSRPGYELRSPVDDVAVIQGPGLAISSTECRRRVAAGAPLSYLVPRRVCEYIGSRGLYAAP